MSTHNIGFCGEISKIIPELSPNTPLICSTEILCANTEGKFLTFVLDKAP